MPTTYPLSTLAPVITSTGISAPTYSDILASLKASFQLIYGSDAYLEADSQDGQLLAVFAQAIYDAGQACIAVYNSFSPQTAVGVGLSNVVKINHMQRNVASNSQVNVLLTGTVGTVINNGLVSDGVNQWALPSSVTIPVGGSITVTATAVKQGAIVALAHTVTSIVTPVAGWFSVDNASGASLGQPIESDAELRTRQIGAPALNSQTTLVGLAASINAIPGVTYGTIYENDTGSTDSNGLPAHSIAVVVAGGDATVIAQTIYNKKGQGVGTYGSTSINITDVSGALKAIHFTVPTEAPLKVSIALTAHDGYTSTIGAAIQQAVANYINAMVIGEDLVVNRLFAPALLGSGSDSLTFTITSLQAGLVSGSVGTSDIVIAFTSKATCLASNVTLTVS